MLDSQQIDEDGDRTLFWNYISTAPVAFPQSVTTSEDTAVAITLTGEATIGASLTYTVVTGPTKGVLSGTAPNLTSTPFSNMNGPDSFTFKVYDGLVDSSPATVSITITPVDEVIFLPLIIR